MDDIRSASGNTERRPFGFVLAPQGEFQITNLKVQMKSKTQITKKTRRNGMTGHFSHFGIPLAFVCLREAASAKAGILKFGINLW